MEQLQTNLEEWAKLEDAIGTQWTTFFTWSYKCVSCFCSNMATGNAYFTNANWLKSIPVGTINV